jgi:hypothetical protein
VSPSPQQLYDELDRFHVPARRDSTWAEWHYFNVLTAPGEWWYFTWLVGGEVPDGRWGGQLLATRRTPEGRYERYVTAVPPHLIRFDTTRADLVLGANTVTQRDGVYLLYGTATGPGGARASRVQFDLTVVPDPARYFPPVELRGEDLYSGYVVPALRAEASGRICIDGKCKSVAAAPAYHDHNWGTWRDVAWEWGMGRGNGFSLLYGGVRTSGDSARGGNRFFLALADSLGIREVLRFATVTYEGSMPAFGAGGTAPARLHLTARRGHDSLRVDVRVISAQSTAARQPGGRTFLQLGGFWTLSGVLEDRQVSDSGSGFFETFVHPPEGEHR